MGKTIFGLKRLSHLSKGKEHADRDTMDIVPLLVESILEDEGRVQEIVDEFKENLDLINVHLKAGALNEQLEGKTRAEQASASYSFAVNKLKSRINQLADELEQH